jgi:hypothetical protein
MTGLKALVAAALISAVPVAFALADEPAAFQAQYPNRDVLNGGALTPAGRLELELPSGAAAPNALGHAYNGMDEAGPVVPARRHHRGRCAHSRAY